VGHFPEKPVMPAVLQLEAMAQAAAVCQVERSGPLDGKVFLFTHVKNAKFSRPVTPGDVLTVRATITRFGSRFAAYSCSCSVGDIKVAEAEIMATVADASSI
jgi:3-hydroxyacyl-[acyl-carrier-protein] dehydratase